MSHNFTRLLLGKDLRSLKGISQAIQQVSDQNSFDELFTLMFHHERVLVMRAADAIEKITLTRPGYLQVHKEQLLSLLKTAHHKELKWHVAQLVSRIPLTELELKNVWHDVLGVKYK